MDAPTVDKSLHNSSRRTSIESGSADSESAGTGGAFQLDKEMFKETVTLLALRIPQRLTGTMIQKLGGTYLLCRPRVKVVVPDEEDSNSKKLLLSEKITSTDLKELPEDLRDYVLSNATVTKHTLQLGYAHLTTEQVLRRVLPPSLPVVSSFETIGHIAHLNLSEEHLPYKRIIGQVILDKNYPRLRTVVNKMHTISSTFRTFAMEVIAGDEDLNTEVTESKCRFAFNYGEVYWNSRLQFEHDRLLKQFRKEDVVCDMFAGVGPFAIPAAKNTGCLVYANDLNPKSYEALMKNAERNKVKHLVKGFNLDAREFVRTLYRRSLKFNQVVMNLPASAETFLDVFKEYPSTWQPPKIHCYMFTKASNARLDVIKRIEEVLEQQLVAPPQIHEVRDVAPNKYMMCVSFILPQQNHSTYNGSVPVLSSNTNNNNNELKGNPLLGKEVENEEEEEEEEEEVVGDEEAPTYMQESKTDSDNNTNRGMKRKRKSSSTSKRKGELSQEVSSSSSSLSTATGGGGSGKEEKKEEKDEKEKEETTSPAGKKVKM
jgi:tRNA (guanine37-N1)-methyltransferase